MLSAQPSRTIYPKRQLAGRLIGLVCAVAAGFWILHWWRGPQVVTSQVIRQDFLQTVVASGHVESPNRIVMSTQMAGTVVQVLVQEGQSVNANQLLIKLNEAEILAVQQQADGALAQAQAKLRQISEVQVPVAAKNLHQAQINLNTAKAALQRSQELFAKGFIGKVNLEDAQNALDLAQAQRHSADIQLGSMDTDGSDYALAVAGVEQAKATAAAAQLRTRYALIRAPVAGVVIAKMVAPGDTVTLGKTLLTLSPNGRPQLVVAIDEKNLRLITIGQSALVSTESYPAQTFMAQVVSIHPAINVQTGAVEVKLDIAQPPAYLRQDMTVSVDIEVARRPAALLLTTTALHDANSPTPWVLQVRDGRLQKTSVHLGLLGGGMAEVLSGLQEGDRVVNATTTAQPGQRVQVLPIHNASAATSTPL